MKLTDSVIRAFKPVKYFKENSNFLNSFSFASNGETLITSSDDDQMVIYDCVSGTPRRTLNSKKYGVNLIRFTHSPSTAIHASTKIDDTLRYLSLHDNKYIRYFQGHTDRVVSLSMSPIDDTFLSGSLDNSIKLWDLRSPNCHGVMYLSGRPTAAFDPEGLIFAAGINSDCIKLYDLRSFDKGPFSTFKFTQEMIGTEWIDLSFSPDGKNLLISTNHCTLRLIDAFRGNIMHSFSLVQQNQLESYLCGTCFSPDSQYLLAGSPEGIVHCWKIDSGICVASLSGYEASSKQSRTTLHCLSFNPRFAMLATGTDQTSFWLPAIDDDQLL